MPAFKSEPQSPSIAGPNSSSGLYFLDERGGGPSGVEQPCNTTSPRYLYYRLYTKGEGLKSHNPIYSNDPFTSRILPKSLTPPQTVLSLKKHLCKIEGYSGSSAILFDSLSSNASLEELTLLKLWGHLGISSREPIVLVVPETRRRVQHYATNELIENPNPLETRYIYYRVYDEEGEVISKAAFDESDTFLGRIDTLSVAPPREVASLKSRIMKVEGIACPDIQLFETTDAEALMKDADHTPFFAETFPGCVEDDPLAFVCGPKKPSSTSTMSQRIRAKCEFRPHDRNIAAGWHKYSEGEILHTDRVMVTLHHLYGPNGEHMRSGTWKGYMAINSAGKVAFVAADDFTFVYYWDDV